MSFSFPSSPSVNQLYTFGNKTWKYNGTGWILVTNLDVAQTAWNKANLANVQANTATVLAQGAFNNSNTKFSSSGGSITGNVSIAGNLSVTGNISYTGNVTSLTVTGNSGQFFGNTTTGFNALYAGIPTGYLIDPQTVFQLTSNYDDYTGLTFQNINQGTQASADLFLLPHNGTLLDTFLDLGIGSATYDYSTSFGSIRPNDGYLIVSGNTTTGGGNLILNSTKNDIMFVAGGTDHDSVVMRVQASNNVIIIPTNPSTSKSSGALIVNGGVGVGGNVYASAVYSDSFYYTNGVSITNVANDAYSKANSASLYANAAFDKANSGTSVYATAAFLQANTGFSTANSSAIYANGAFEQANAAYQSQNTTGSYANSAYSNSNTAVSNASSASLYANGAFAQTNASFIAANTADSKAVSAGAYANAAFDKANSGTSVYATAAFLQANTGFDTANSAFIYANGSFTQANASYGQANSASTYANGAFTQSNSAFGTANSAALYANGAFLAANTADNKAVASGSYANSAYTQSNTATTNAAGASLYANSAFVQSNAAFLQANTPSYTANSAAIYANGAFVQANAAYAAANAAGSSATVVASFIQANSAFGTANSAALYANAAFLAANNATDTWVRNQANGAFIQANAAFNKANTITTAGYVDAFVADGATDSFVLSVTPADKNVTFATVQGVLQPKSVYSLSGSTLTFDFYPPPTAAIEVTTLTTYNGTGGSGGSGSGSIVYRGYTGNNTQSNFTISSGLAVNNLLVAENGILQRPTTDYTISGTNVVFSTPPANSVDVQIREIKLGGGSSFTWSIVSANTTMSSSTGYFVDTSNGPKTMTLPSSATLGDTIRINDLAGTFGPNNLTVARNGHKIQGTAADLIVSINQSSFGLVYSNSTYGWKTIA